MQLQTVMLCLRHDFYNTNFKTRHKLYITLRYAPPPRQNSRCAAALRHSAMPYKTNPQY